MRNHVAQMLAVRQTAKQCGDILLRRFADGEVVEGVNASTIRRRDLLEKVGLRKALVCAGGIREGAVDEHEVALCGIGRPGFETQRAGSRGRDDVKPTLRKTVFRPRVLFPTPGEFRKSKRDSFVDERLGDLENDGLYDLRDQAPSTFFRLSVAKRYAEVMERTRGRRAASRFRDTGVKR